MKNKNTEDEDLETRVLQLEKFRNHVLITITIFLAILGFLGIGAWQTLSSKLVDLQDNADKIDATQQRITDNLTTITTETSKRYGEMLARLDDLRSAAARAKNDAEYASNTAGNLRDSINQSKAAAESAEKAARETADLAEQARDASEKSTSAMKGMQETQRALEKYLSKRMPPDVEKKSFNVTVSGNLGDFYFIPGDSLPYDRTFSSNNSNGTIWVSENTYVTVKVTGNNNDLNLHRDLEGRVNIENSGNLNDQVIFK